MVLIAVSSLLFGLLTAFAAWAVAGALSARQALVLDMAGEVTVMSFQQQPDGRTDQRVLRDFLSAQKLTLVGASTGDGAPQITVFDPGGNLPWMPQVPAAAYEEARTVILPVTGSYAEARYLRTGQVPYLSDVQVLDAVVIPRQGTDLQYVRPLQDFRLLPGQYSVNTTDPQVLRAFRAQMSDAGLEVSTSSSIPVPVYLAQNPLVVITCLLVGAGAGAILILLVLHWQAHARSFGTRARHGATPLRLVLDELRSCLPWLVAGCLLGSLLSATLVGAASGDLSLGPAATRTAVSTAGAVAAMLAVAESLLTLTPATILAMVPHRSPAATLAH